MLDSPENWIGTVYTTLAGPNVRGGCYKAKLTFTINMDDTIHGSLQGDSNVTVYSPLSFGVGNAPSINAPVTGNYDETANQVNLVIQMAPYDMTASVTGPGGSGTAQAEVTPTQLDLQEGALNASSFSAILSPALGKLTETATDAQGNSATQSESVPSSSPTLSWTIPPINKVSGGSTTITRVYGNLTVNTIVTIRRPGIDIDWQFISTQEGGQQLDGYVPMRNGVVIGNSGVTIATGVDLGQMTQNSLNNLPISDSLKDELSPYVGLRRQAAVNALQENPLNISEQDANQLDSAVSAPIFQQLAQNYDQATAPSAFENLSPELQTAIADVAYQYGPNLARATATSNFWNDIIAGNWEQTVTELQNLARTRGYEARRDAEAALVQQALNNNPC